MILCLNKDEERVYQGVRQEVQDQKYSRSIVSRPIDAAEFHYQLLLGRYSSSPSKGSGTGGLTAVLSKREVARLLSVLENLRYRCLFSCTS